VGRETLTLSFDKVNYDYKEQGKNGIMTSAGQMTYDLALSKTN
jgi:type VI protein secretion system component Hcp